MAVMRQLAPLLAASLLLVPFVSMCFWANQRYGLTAAAQQTSSACEKVGVPPQSTLYHGVYPGGINTQGDDIAPSNVSSYERLAGKSVAWVELNDNWWKGRSFPLQTATWIRGRGSVPYIRLILKSSDLQNVSEPMYTLDRIMNGTFDADLRAWADAARNFSSPLLVEYGTEVNGFWFPWNGVWNGGGTLNGTQPLGPQKFREAYSHVVQVMRSEGACNITWVFHANNQDIPDESWNHLENYYPGDKWIDWIGVSVYGPQSPIDNETRQFRDLMDQVYPRLASLNSTKPIVLIEFGASSGNPRVNQTTWASSALGNLTAFRWPRLIGFSWWNEAWPNDNNPAHNSDMRLQDSPALASVFMKYVGLRSGVLGTAVIVGPSATTTTSTTSSASTTSNSTSATTRSSDSTGILIPLFVDPGSLWTTVEQQKASYANVPFVVIINPNDGPGSSQQSSYVAGVRQMQSAGITVIGYVATGYASQSIGSVESQINSYHNWYHVNGIFFDEMSHVSGYETYYSTLSSYAKSLGMTYTVGNPGTTVPTGYIGTVDMIVIYENPSLPGTSYISGLYPSYGKSNFGVIAYGVSQPTQTYITSISNRVSYVYFTDDGDSNPYDSLPSYLSNELAMLKTVDTSLTTTQPSSSSTSSFTSSTSSSSSSSSISSFSSTTTSTSMSTTTAITPAGGGGIPEFPYQTLAFIGIVGIIIGSYLLVRRSYIRELIIDRTDSSGSAARNVRPRPS